MMIFTDENSSCLGHEEGRRGEAAGFEYFRLTRARAKGRNAQAFLVWNARIVPQSHGCEWTLSGYAFCARMGAGTQY